MTVLQDFCSHCRVNTYLVRHGTAGATRLSHAFGWYGYRETQLRKNISAMNQETHYSQTVNMNYYTDSYALQMQLEEPIDKRSGRSYGPPSLKKLIYFVDDLNMPFKEEYGTQTPIALPKGQFHISVMVRCSDPSLKKTIYDIQFVAAMNPTSGSFTINPRLQRHFAVLGLAMPQESDLRLIFSSVLEGHLSMFQSDAVAKECHHLVSAVIEIHQTVSAKFLPSAVKFHYNFNMRELVNVLWSSKYDFRNVSPSCTGSRLFYHESARVLEIA